MVASMERHKVAVVEETLLPKDQEYEGKGKELDSSADEQTEYSSYSGGNANTKPTAHADTSLVIEPDTQLGEYYGSINDKDYMNKFIRDKYDILVYLLVSVCMAIQSDIERNHNCVFTSSLYLVLSTEFHSPVLPVLLLSRSVAQQGV